MDAPRPQHPHRAAWLIIIAAFLLSCAGAFRASQGDLASSRLATVYSLTEHRTWYIDQPDNPFTDDTIDKVMVRGDESGGVMRGGRMISSKPPVMPLLMTGVYLAARPFTRWSLQDDDHVDRLLILMTITLVSASFLLALVCFHATLNQFDLTRAGHLVLLVTLAFGTQVAGFSSTINNHVPAAGALMLTMCLGISVLRGRAATAYQLLGFGFAGALVPTLDMPAGIYVAALGTAVAANVDVRKAAWILAGGALPLLVHFGATVAATGSIMPVQMREVTYFYESAYWRHPLGIDALSEPKLTYLFHITFGRCGTFLLFPILLLGPIGAVIGLWQGPRPIRAGALASLACFALLTAYYVTSTNNYGGESYGFRWYIASMPVLLVMAVPAMQRVKSTMAWVLVTVMLAVSMYSTFECARAGWQSGREWTSRIFGPAYQQVAPDEP